MGFSLFSGSKHTHLNIFENIYQNPNSLELGDKISVRDRI